MVDPLISNFYWLASNACFLQLLLLYPRHRPASFELAKLYNLDVAARVHACMSVIQSTKFIDCDECSDCESLLGTSFSRTLKIDTCGGADGVSKI
jgi:hypothetical protein